MPSETPYYNPTFNEAWEADFFRYVAEKEANQQWSSLIFGGNPYLLMRLAFAAWDARIDLLEVHRSELRILSDKIRAKLSKIREAADDITELDLDLTGGKGNFSKAIELAEKVRCHVTFLLGVKEVIKEMTSERLPGTGDYFEFVLHHYILKATGKPQWGAMATLLEAAAWATSHRDSEVDDDCLRKKMNLMPTRDPDRCAHLKQTIEQYVFAGNGDWPSLDDLRQLSIDVANEIIEACPITSVGIQTAL